jgi:hypothetical protein
VDVARNTTSSLEDALRNTSENQPYTAVIIALGLGWLLGRMLVLSASSVYVRMCMRRQAAPAVAAPPGPVNQDYTGGGGNVLAS